MNQKHIGLILIAVGILAGLFVYMAKAREDRFISTIIMEKGSCYLDDGTCLHEDRDFTLYVIGAALSGVLIIFGMYLSFIDRTQEVLYDHQIKVTNALKEAKSAEKNKDEFKAFLAGFSEDEQKILAAIKDQDGILQSTLRYKTDLSKTTVSLILKSLEERNIISRKEHKKTKEVYLKKRF
ncbi:MAG: MarR family transcriptional regulator [Nanoarchaeota archaeon]|nr:MarR family transcriptional regulator [Nanoarchaeota archaeon]